MSSVEHLGITSRLLNEHPRALKTLCNGWFLSPRISFKIWFSSQQWPQDFKKDASQDTKKKSKSLVLLYYFYSPILSTLRMYKFKERTVQHLAQYWKVLYIASCWATARFKIHFLNIYLTPLPIAGAHLQHQTAALVWGLDGTCWAQDLLRAAAPN